MPVGHPLLHWGFLFTAELPLDLSPSLFLFLIFPTYFTPFLTSHFFFFFFFFFFIFSFSVFSLHFFVSQRPAAPNRASFGLGFSFLLFFFLFLFLFCLERSLGWDCAIDDGAWSMPRSAPIFILFCLFLRVASRHAARPSWFSQRQQNKTKHGKKKTVKHDPTRPNPVQTDENPINPIKSRWKSEQTR